jgi:hypothetical protein
MTLWNGLRQRKQFRGKKVIRICEFVEMLRSSAIALALLRTCLCHPEERRISITTEIPHFVQNDNRIVLALHVTL